MPDPMSATRDQRKRYTRDCIFCGNSACVLLPPAASELDVDAEFSGQGREFADVPDGDPIGVGCYRCSRAQWRKQSS